MASTNQSPFYQRAEEDFLKATTDGERIQCLEIMIKECPKHKSSENMLKNLTTRLKKFKDKSDKSRKGKKGQQQTFKKAPCQIVLIGKPNTGKSTFFNLITQKKIKSKTTENAFTTKRLILGDFTHETAKIQIIVQPSIPYHDKSIINTTDVLLIFVNSIEDIKETENYVWKSQSNKIYIFNKIDLLKDNELRKIKATLSSKHKNKEIFFISSINPNSEDLKSLKTLLWENFSIIRVYTKEPKKEPTKEPLLIKKNSNVKKVAEKIHKKLSKNIKKAKIWGPSSKFKGQIVGLNHKLKDKDIVELQ